MENIAKDFIACKPLSPTDSKSKSDTTINTNPTQNAHADVARIEGGRSSGGERRKSHSYENIRIPRQVLELTCDQDTGRKRWSSMPMIEIDSVQEPIIEVTDVEGPPKGSTSTSIINHKRKLYEGRDEISKKKVTSFNDTATQWNEVKFSNAQKHEVGPSIAQKNDIGHAIRFDLNHSPIDEGEEVNKKVRENEDSPHTPGLQGFDLNHQTEGEMYSSIDVAYKTAVEPTGGMKSEMEPPIIEEIEAKNPSLEKNIAFAIDTEEMESSAMEENDNGGDARIFKFDLNEVPIAEEDED